MCDEWMPLIKLPIGWDEFQQLPRNADYKYEYFDETAFLTPRPRHYHTLLDLGAFQPDEAEAVEPVTLRRATADDCADLVELFTVAFRRIQPFGSLDDATRTKAARKALEKTRTDGDGPLIEAASFVALSGEERQAVGAILITLLP